ncbi:MAG: hypothetical protein J6S67_07420 [Methanobrevibacter sp.]|nr:hypothetical protein [Methanobrevibacter sp.]
MKRKEKILIGLVAIALMALCIVVLFIPLTSSFDDANKYHIEKHVVSQGETAWDIYQATCPGTDWNAWCAWVGAHNEINLELIYPGDIINVPVKNK